MSSGVAAAQCLCTSALMTRLHAVYFTHCNLFSTLQCVLTVVAKGTAEGVRSWCCVSAHDCVVAFRAFTKGLHLVMLQWTPFGLPRPESLHSVSTVT